LKYRDEIDGLRALAVLPVLFFHAGFELFSGGYIGVDIFFVISGYLITTILINDIEQDKFSLLNFYERRARRILPVLFFVMAISSVFAWFLMSPNQLKDYSESLIAVSLFLSNFLFWSESGYFEETAEEKPLLHTWSLAVEEQYYILFPLFLLFAWRFGKDRLFLTIIALAAFSLLLSEWSWRHFPSANFYLIPTRAWELFAGSITAFLIQKNGVRKNNLLSITGLVVIMISIFLYDKETPFPSIYALLPVMGTALIILFAPKETIVARFLSIRLIVAIGLISYSTYLWHQPLFAFTRLYMFEKPSDVMMLTLCVMSLILAVFSWKFVEQPFRGKAPLLPRRKSVFIVSFIGIALFSAIGFAGHKYDGWEGRFNMPDSVYLTMTRTDREEECFGKKDVLIRDDWTCSLGLDSQKKSFLVWGDSHALSILPAMDQAAHNLGKSGEFVGINTCMPFLGVYTTKDDRRDYVCHKLNQRVFDYVGQQKIPYLFLVARWTYYTDGGYDGDEMSYIGLEKNIQQSKENSRIAFEQGLKQTIAAYKEIGTNIVLITQVPQQRAKPFDIYVRALMKETDDLSALSISRKEHEGLQSYVYQILGQQEENNMIEILSFDDALCSEETCSVGTKHYMYYYDDDHLSITGSMLLVDPLTKFLENSSSL